MRAGTAVRDITPTFKMPMSGYGARVDHYDGVHDSLSLTAVYLTEGGQEAWIVCADICQFPDGQPGRDGRARVAQALGVPVSALFLNASHTHGGPLMSVSVAVPTPSKLLQRGGANRLLAEKYREFLWLQLEQACREARANAAPCVLRYAEGETRFPINRRLMVDGELVMAPNTDGDVDPRLRLLSVEAAGRILALGLVLACHPTATGPQHLLTADYVGAWRRCLAPHLEETTSLFFLQGCAGDVRPACTSTGDGFRVASHLELEEMGQQLTRETLQTMEGPWRKLTHPVVRHSSTEVFLPCVKPYDSRTQGIEYFRSMEQASSPAVQAYAANARKILEQGRDLRSEVPLEIALLALDEELILAGGSCEYLVKMGRKIEMSLPVPVGIALGYTNGCFGYLPDSEELARGGYEAESHLWDAITGPLAPEAEDVVLKGHAALYSRMVSNRS